jgi:hypothetical protein
MAIGIMLRKINPNLQDLTIFIFIFDGINFNSFEDCHFNIYLYLYLYLYLYYVAAKNY